MSYVDPGEKRVQVDERASTKAMRTTWTVPQTAERPLCQRGESLTKAESTRKWGQRNETPGPCSLYSTMDHWIDFGFY